MGYKSFERSIARRAKMKRLKQSLLIGMAIAMVVIGIGFAAVYGVVRLIRLILTHE